MWIRLLGPYTTLGTMCLVFIATFGRSFFPARPPCPPADVSRRKKTKRKGLARVSSHGSLFFGCGCLELSLLRLPRGLLPLGGLLAGSFAARLGQGGTRLGHPPAEPSPYLVLLVVAIPGCRPREKKMRNIRTIATTRASEL